MAQDKCILQGETNIKLDYVVTDATTGTPLDIELSGALAIDSSAKTDTIGTYENAIIRGTLGANDPWYNIEFTPGTLKVGKGDFEITPRNISNATKKVNPESDVYTGGVHTPDITLTDILNGVETTLTINTDYMRKWPADMTNVGGKLIPITGEGNYKGTVNATYEIKVVSSENVRIIIDDENNDYDVYKYTGQSIQPIIRAFDGQTQLTQGIDFIITWPKDTTLPGTKLATITLLGKYGGVKLTATYRIGIQSEYGDKLLNILPQEPPFWPTYVDGTKIPGKFQIVEGYQYSIEDPFVGDVTWVTGATLDKDTILRPFNVGLWPDDGAGRDYLKSINNIKEDDSGNIVYCPREALVLVGQKPLTADMITMDESGTYTGSDITPEVTVKNGETTLALGTDYTVSYEGNREDVGPFEVKITATDGGNYSGEVTKTFMIEKAPITDSYVELSYESVPYDGKEHEQIPTVTVNEVTLTEGQDYKVTGDKNPTNASDSYSIKVTGQGNYSGEVEKTFTIEQAPITDSDVNLSYTTILYNGHEQIPEVIVSGLIEDRDFEVVDIPLNPINQGEYWM